MTWIYEGTVYINETESGKEVVAPNTGQVLATLPLDSPLSGEIRANVYADGTVEEA